MKFLGAKWCNEWLLLQLPLSLIINAENQWHFKTFIAVLRAVALLPNRYISCWKSNATNKFMFLPSFLNWRFILIYSSNSRPLFGIEDCLSHPPSCYSVFHYFNNIIRSESRIKSSYTLCEVLSHDICISLSRYKF